jgi:hypothetical protein
VIGEEVVAERADGRRGPEAEANNQDENGDRDERKGGPAEAAGGPWTGQTRLRGVNRRRAPCRRIRRLPGAVLGGSGES